MVALQESVQLPAKRPKKRQGWWLLPLAVVVLATLAYMLQPYVPPDMQHSRITPRSGPHFCLLVAHIGTAAIATITGLLQFWPWLRNNHPKTHRWTGRAYFFVGVFPSTILAIPVAALSVFGAANMAALYAFDICWLVTAIAGYRAARQRRFADHRRWMIRNYAVTLGSVFSRFWQPVVAFAVISMADTDIYRGSEVAIAHDIASGSAWLGLVVNLIVAEAYIQRRYGIPKRTRTSVA
ncbi:DUF2306 domain-containing protein [Fodinicola acaciae]|uniref:DUF2306 domain-containing protein n=1 Tax=Fodinicola acaciae TaxID=2681555 RepID=UPI0013D75C69|nr:DUF2306 domain-containing protein [Fodinicola acaciae]